MQFHKEGRTFLISVFIILAALILLVYLSSGRNGLYTGIASGAGVLLFIFFLRFFRKPDRPVTLSDHTILSSADGKVVVVEETTEEEYFHDRRIQISVFMSVWDVHINWYPVSGAVKYYQYHPGKYLVARHPKSSTLNERNTALVRRDDGKEILVRQIAGYVARKISSYCHEGDNVSQGDELGFIKFGSRVDIFLPADAKVLVKPGQKVRGKISVLAEL